MTREGQAVVARDDQSETRHVVSYDGLTEDSVAGPAAWLRPFDNPLASPIVEFTKTGLP